MTPLRKASAARSRCTSWSCRRSFSAEAVQKRSVPWCASAGRPQCRQAASSRANQRRRGEKRLAARSVSVACCSTLPPGDCPAGSQRAHIGHNLVASTAARTNAAAGRGRRRLFNTQRVFMFMFIELFVSSRRSKETPFHSKFFSLLGFRLNDASTLAAQCSARSCSRPRCGRGGVVGTRNRNKGRA